MTKTDRELILAKYDGLVFKARSQDYWTGTEGNCFMADFAKWRMMLGIKGPIDEGIRLDIAEYIDEWAGAATPKEISLAVQMNVAGLFPTRVVVPWNVMELTRPILAEILEHYSEFRDKAQKALNNKILLLQPPDPTPDKKQTDKIIWQEILNDAEALQLGNTIDFYELKYDFLERTGKKVFTAEEKIEKFEDVSKIPPQQFVYPILNPEKYQNDVKLMRIYLSKKQLYTQYLKTLANEG